MGTINRLIKKSPGFIKKISYSIIPFAYRYGSTYRKYEKFLLQSEKKPLSEIKKYQIEKLNKVLWNAYDNTKFYRDIFLERNITPDDINSIEDLKKLPIITKEIVKKNAHLIINNKVKKIGILKTSGSTGEQLIIKVSQKSFEKEAAFVERSYRSHNSTLYYKKTIWLRRYCPIGNEPFYYEDKELNRLYLSAYHLSKYTINDYVDIINSYKAETISAYPSSIYILSQLIKDTNLKLKYVRAAHVSSEALSEEWKIKAENILNIPIRDHYGMLEHISFHHKCLYAKAYHDNLEYGVTEVIDNNVIATGFINEVMPLIRYKMNDVAILNKNILKCPCGSNLPLTIKKIEGRSDDILQARFGNSIPPVNFYTNFGKMIGVDMFKLIQHDYKNIEILIVPNKDYSERTKESVKKIINDKMGNVRIDYKVVDEIDRSKETGKIRCIENRIKE